MSVGRQQTASAKWPAHGTAFQAPSAHTSDSRSCVRLMKGLVTHSVLRGGREIVDTRAN
mgnify:CR=1 FL=1